MTTISVDSVLEGVDIGVALIGIEATSEPQLLAANQAARELLGIGDLDGRPGSLQSLLPESSLHGINRLLDPSRPSRHRRVVLLAGGWAITSSTLMDDPNLLCVSLRRAEGPTNQDQLARIADQQVAPIFGNNPVNVSMLASRESIPLIDHLFETLCPYDDHEQQYLARIHPADRANTMAAARSVAAGYVPHAEICVRSQSEPGKEILVDTTFISLAGSSIEATVVVARPRSSNNNSQAGLITSATAMSGRSDTSRWDLKNIDPLRLRRSMQVLGEALARHLTGELLEWQSLYDSLTGLATRALLLDRTQEAMIRSGEAVSLLHLDLDQFKRINDSLGRTAGDALLLAVAERLSSIDLRANTLARIGGDEFVVLLENRDPISTARAINEALLDPFVIMEVPVTVSASIGIDRAYPGEHDPVGLLSRADTAMSRAKEAGRSRFEFFDPTMQNHVRHQVATEELLRRSMIEGSFHLVYQPIVDLRSGVTKGYEALLRWDQPGRPNMSPGEFIPIAERMGLINELGTWVLDEGLAQMTRWREIGDHTHHLYLSVNLSPLQLQDPDIVATINNCLASHGVPADRLVLELTESAVMDDAASALHVLTRLKDLGLQLSIDDFGTGYSSLAYLKRFPVDYLKIDRAFITELAHNESDRAITRAMTHLADAMNLGVIAEGIESHEQLAALQDLGCVLGQGYYFARPLDPEHITVDLRDGQ